MNGFHERTLEAGLFKVMYDKEKNIKKEPAEFGPATKTIAPKGHLNKYIQ